MGETQDRAVDIVSEAEIGIRSLIAEAAKVGDYAQVNRLSTAAQKLVALRDEIRTPTTRAPETDAGDRAAKKRKTRRRRAAGASRTGKPGYPRFETRNGVLVKIGWSKKARQEYEHKVPYDAYVRTVEAIAGLAHDASQLVTADHVLERLNTSGGSRDVPAYQVYIILALLTRQGAIEKCGREGYFVRAESLLSRMSNLWHTVEEA